MTFNEWWYGIGTIYEQGYDQAKEAWDTQQKRIDELEEWIKATEHHLPDWVKHSAKCLLTKEDI